MLCMEYLVDLFVLDLRYRNRREKIYRNVIFSLKYMVHHIFYSYGKYLNLQYIGSHMLYIM
jgi:hypothetical protein